jgi:hypothetical protein
MPPPDPLTRLRQVETGLHRLAWELSDTIGSPPFNLFWWRDEVRSVIAALERQACASPTGGSGTGEVVEPAADEGRQPRTDP